MDPFRIHGKQNLRTRRLLCIEDKVIPKMNVDKLCVSLDLPQKNWPIQHIRDFCPEDAFLDDEMLYSDWRILKSDGMKMIPMSRRFRYGFGRDVRIDAANDQQESPDLLHGHLLLLSVSEME